MYERKQMMSECYRCTHRREVPGDGHIRCNKPDPNMTGHARGISRGWFHYPTLFDPVWKTALCANFEEE